MIACRKKGLNNHLPESLKKQDISLSPCCLLFRHTRLQICEDSDGVTLSGAFQLTGSGADTFLLDFNNNWPHLPLRALSTGARNSPRGTGSQGSTSHSHSSIRRRRGALCSTAVDGAGLLVRHPQSPGERRIPTFQNDLCFGFFLESTSVGTNVNAVRENSASLALPPVNLIDPVRASVRRTFLRPH